MVAVQIFEKKESQKNQRIQILEMLLQDARSRNERLRVQCNGEGIGDSSSRRVISNTARPIYGGKAHSARVAQIQVIP